MLRAGADGGAPMALVLLAHSHIDEHRMTGSEEPLDTAERLLHELDPPPPGSHGAGAATTAAAKSWTRLAGVLKDTGDLDRARRLYQRAIDLGDVGAINDLGTTWHGLDRDKEREWYERAVAAGNPMGHYNLGTQLWEDGKAANDPLLLEEAERLLRVAVADGNLDAHHNLGQLLVHRDDPAAQAEGERLLRTASDRGHLGARFALTDVLKQDPSRVDEAEAILRELVDEHDHVDALNDLALLLWNRGTEESVDEAEALYRRALEHDPDDAIVLTNLAVLLRRRGETDEEACQESRRTSERAAELGHLPARYNLGNWYRDHDRLDEAAQEYRKAVAEGHVAAHCDLAAILDDSDDPADLDEAERLYRWTVGEHEHALSMNHLGVLLLRRDGDRSRDEAFDLIRRSAEAGEGIAVGSWGKVLYQQGEHDKAREWLRRGAREGSARAKQLLELWDDGQTEYLEQWMPAITGAARRD
jgi:TPR repeat protein